MLLFSIGLKLNPRDIAEPRVIGTAAGHAVTNTVLRAAVFGVLGLLPLAALGALIAGIMLSGHPVSDRFSDALVSVRELLLVAFFIQIGLAGLPNGGGIFIAGVLTVLLVAKAGLFIVFLQRVGMSNRTSALDGPTLANYSEFGLIIISVGVGAGVLAPSWLPIMGVAVAASFIVGSVVMRWEDRILPVLLRSIPEVAEERPVPDERAVVVRHCDALVLGMGRVGEGGVPAVVGGLRQARVRHRAGLRAAVVRAGIAGAPRGHGADRGYPPPSSAGRHREHHVD